MESHSDLIKRSILLKQRSDHLESELEDSRRREKNVTAMYSSLLQTVQNGGATEQQALENLQKTHRSQIEEITEIKSAHTVELTTKEKEIHELKMKNKELELEMKKINVITERKELEMLQRVQEAENEKMNYKQNLASIEDEYATDRSNSFHSLELRLKETQKELEIVREETQNEIVKVQTDAEATLNDMKEAFFEEKQRLKTQVDILQEKYSLLDSKRAQLRDEVSIDTNIQFAPAPSASQSTPPFQRTANSSQPISHGTGCTHCITLNGNMQKVLNVLGEQKQTIEMLVIQKEKLEVGLERAKLQMRESTMDLSSMDSNENEERLKQEVKYLVSKLMKVESKLHKDDNSHLEYTVKRDGRKPSPYAIRRSLAYPNRYSPRESGKYLDEKNLYWTDYGY